MGNERTVNKKIIISEIPETPKYENKIRKSLYRTEQVFDAFDLVPEKLGELAEYLDNEGRAVNEVYFCEDGHYYFNCHTYENEKYSRFIKKTFFSPETLNLVETQIELLPNTKIIKTVKAEEIIHLYYGWVKEQSKEKNNNKQNKK